MKVVFTAEAILNLSDIASYLRARNPVAAKAVRRAIRKSADTLGEFPELGRKQLNADIRKLVVPRFGYLIYFKVYAEIDEVRILFIQHPNGIEASPTNN
jgi:plasmid stabilization system protein ParE